MADSLFPDMKVTPGWSAAEVAFEKARKAYPKKSNLRGHDREWADFRRYNPTSYLKAAHELYPAIQVIIAWKARELTRNGYTTPWKDFCRFCRYGLWEQAAELEKQMRPPAPRDKKRPREPERIGEIVTPEQKRAILQAYEAKTGKKLTHD